MIDSSNQQTDDVGHRRSSLVKSGGIRLVLIALAIVLLPFLYFRLTSEGRKLVRCDYLETVSVSHQVGGKSSTFRVAMWNIAY